MKMKQIPVALAFALAIAAMASGCAQDQQPARAADAGAVAETAHADAEADAHTGVQEAGHPDAVAHAVGTGFPVPDNHQPWTPDAPLVEGMSRVRRAIAALEGQPDEAAVVARAADVDAAVKYMFANCKLEPDPDIALHAILAQLMTGTLALHANPADVSPVADMHAAVESYERQFDDPNSGAGATS